MTQPTKPCDVLGIFSFLSKRWTLLVIKALAEGADTFSEIARYLPGISSRILSERLKELENEGFIRRDIVSEQPIKIRYGLTEKGLSFRDCIEAISAWQDRWEKA